MTIQILSDEVASQIAAGEVIERPASVVKELMENALDAQARQLTIHVEQAGKRVIEIADDGCGIPEGELKLAVMRHATSKLRSAADLFHISTLGFRGEALASIGSVSRMSITSRAASSTVGAYMLVEGGSIRAHEEIGAPQGTVIRVEDLFYNVPARLKFLKTDTTERQQIDGLVTRYALAYPNLRVQLYEDERAVLRTSGNGDQREVLANLYGVDIAKQMLSIDLAEENYQISGFISPVSLTRSNRREITFFVNGRWVQDSALNAALMQAYRTLLMVGRYPISVLFLQVAPEEVDVNVHPAKAEVRFRSPDRVFSLVQRAVKRGLLAYSPVQQIVPTTWNSRGFQWDANTNPAQVDPAWQMAADSAQSQATDIEQGSADLTGFQPASGENQPGLPASDLPILRLIGQIGSTYLVAEGPDGLYLIDQHAAHERVLFERFMQQADKSIPAQTLLEPVVLHLPPHAAVLLNDQLDELSHLGFQVEPFGPNTFQIRSVPALFAGGDPAAAVRVVVEDFEEDETPLQSMKEAKLIARICKRIAVKGGQTLSTEEQKVLLRDLESCRSPRTCPHGRPTMIHLSVDLLERQFGRRGSR